jgi:hypothetical protein
MNLAEMNLAEMNLTERNLTVMRNKPTPHRAEQRLTALFASCGALETAYYIRDG